MNNSEMIRTIEEIAIDGWTYVGSFDSEGAAYKFTEIERSNLYKDFKVIGFNNQYHIFKKASI